MFLVKKLISSTFEFIYIDLESYIEFIIVDFPDLVFPIKKTPTSEAGILLENSNKFLISYDKLKEFVWKYSNQYLSVV